MKKFTMPLTLNKLWNWTDAVEHLILDLQLFDKDKNLRSRLPLRLDQVLNGQWAPIEDDETLKPYQQALRQFVTALRVTFSKPNSSVPNLPPALWMRWFKEQGYAVSSSLVAAMVSQQYENAADGVYYLYRYETIKSDSKKGPIHEATNKRGFTSTELLEAHREKVSGWPCQLTWDVSKRLSGKSSKRAASPRASQDSLDSKNKLPKEIKSIKNVDANKAAPKRRSRKEICRLCGTGVVDALEHALGIEIQRKTKTLITKRKTSRPYAAELSQTELIEQLQKRHRSIASIADSTLKRAIGYFVLCPRGRPPTLAELAQQTQSKQKR